MIGRLAHGSVIACLLAFPLAAPGAEKTSQKSDGEKTSPNLDGVWRGYVVEGKGEHTERGQVHLELSIKGNRVSAERLDAERGPLGQGTYRIKTGKLMLMDGIEGRTRGRARTYLGICQLDDEVIRWCVATPGNKRPKDFETKGQQFLLILKRQGEKQD